MNYLTVDVDEVFLPHSIYIVLALYKLLVKFELKLLRKSMVLPLSLRSVTVFVLIALNTTEANPIKLSQGEEKKTVFSCGISVSLLGEFRFDDREAASNFKFKE